MKRALLLLGALAVASLIICLGGCILHTRTLTITISDYVCTGFSEDHNSENYTGDNVTVDDSFFADLDEILMDNDMTKADVEGGYVVGVYYQVESGPTPPPAPATDWTVSGQVWVQVDDRPRILIATYQSVELTPGMGPADAVRIETVPPGLAELDYAIELYLGEDNPFNYPDVVFTANRANGDIDPSPTLDFPFVMDWNGCLSMRVDFTEEYDVYDIFPGD